jgi:hypothetical protein
MKNFPIYSNSNFNSNSNSNYHISDIKERLRMCFSCILDLG